MTDTLLLLILIVVTLDFLRGTRVGETIGRKINGAIFWWRTRKRK